MAKTQIDSATLLIAVLAGGLALLLLPTPLVWMGSIGGLILLILLFSFDQEGYRTPAQSFVFGGACGFSAAIALAAVYNFLANNGEVHLANGRWQSVFVPITAALATAGFWAIDLMRMNGRKVAPIHVPRALGETTLLPGILTPPPSQTYQAPAPISYQPPPPPVSYQPPAPVSYQPPPPPVPPAPQPSPVIAAVPEPVAAPHELSTATSLFAVPSPPPPAEPAPLYPGPQSIVSQSGKEVEIYVSLLGEGLNLMRTVRAEPLGHDYYRILEDMPEGETWQFGPGQVVKCKKKNLSTGKAMVAMEEAPRSA